MEVKKQHEERQAKQADVRQMNETTVEKIQAGKVENAVLVANSLELTEELDSANGKRSKLEEEGAALEKELAELKRQAEAATVQSMEGAGYDCY